MYLIIHVTVSAMYFTEYVGKSPHSYSKVAACSLKPRLSEGNPLL